MPAYSSTIPAIALYPGNQLAVVNNAAVDANVTTTQQFAVGPTPDNHGSTVMITNTTNQQAQGEFAPQDIAANYQDLSGCIIPAGSSLPYNLTGGWMRFTFTSAPTSGSLIICR